MLLSSGQIYEFGPFRLDVGEARLSRGGDVVHLPPRAFDLLTLLVKNAGRVVTKEQLMAEVWAGTFVEEGNLTVHISTIRKILGADAGWVETVPRRGYRFLAPVRELLLEAPEIPLVVMPAAEPAPPEPVADRDTVRVAVSIPLAPPAAARPHARRLWLGAAALIVLAIVAVGFWVRERLRPGGVAVAPIRSLVIMPFETAGGDSSERFLQVGIPGALAARLSQLPELRLTATAAVRPGERPFDAGRRLRVDGVITGTVTRDGQNVELAVQLLRVSDGAVLWSGQFDRPPGGMIPVENEIAEQVGARAVPHLPPAQRATLRVRETPSGDAYMLYLRALDQWDRRTPAAIRTAIAMYQNAITLDPRFARAYAGLADAYAVSASGMPPADRFPLAKAAARQALALDSHLAEAHAALGFLDYKADWQWAEANGEFTQALALSPDYALAHHWYGEFLGLLGRYDAAIGQMEQARTLDPYSTAILADYANVLRKAGRLREAQAMLADGLRVEPGAPLLSKWMGLVLGEQGDAPGAIEYDLRSRRLGGEAPEDTTALRKAFDAGGVQAYERTYINLLLARRGRAAALPVGLASELAASYAALHDKADTMKWLVAAADAHEDAPLELNSPEYGFLAGDPRFEALKKRVGL